MYPTAKNSVVLLLGLILSALLPAFVQSLAYPAVYGTKRYHRRSPPSLPQAQPDAMLTAVDYLPYSLVEGPQLQQQQPMESPSDAEIYYDQLMPGDLTGTATGGRPEGRDSEYYGMPTYTGEYNPKPYYYAPGPSYSVYEDDIGRKPAATNPLDDLHEQMLRENAARREQLLRQQIMANGGVGVGDNDDDDISNQLQSDPVTSRAFFRNLMAFNAHQQRLAAQQQQQNEYETQAMPYNSANNYDDVEAPRYDTAEYYEQQQPKTPPASIANHQTPNEASKNGRRPAEVDQNVEALQSLAKSPKAKNNRKNNNGRTKPNAGAKNTKKPRINKNNNSNGGTSKSQQPQRPAKEQRKPKSERTANQQQKQQRQLEKQRRREQRRLQREQQREQQRRVQLEEEAAAIAAAELAAEQQAADEQRMRYEQLAQYQEEERRQQAELEREQQLREQLWLEQQQQQDMPSQQQQQKQQKQQKQQQRQQQQQQQQQQRTTDAQQRQNPTYDGTHYTDPEYDDTWSSWDRKRSSSSSNSDSFDRQYHSATDDDEPTVDIDELLQDAIGVVYEHEQQLMRPKTNNHEEPMRMAAYDRGDAEQTTEATPTTTTMAAPAVTQSANGNVRSGQKEFMLPRPATPVRRPFTAPIMQLLAAQKEADDNMASAADSFVSGMESDQSNADDNKDVSRQSTDREMYATIRQLIQMDQQLEKETNKVKRQYIRTADESLEHELRNVKQRQTAPSTVA